MSSYTAQAGLELAIPLPLPPEYCVTGIVSLSLCSTAKGFPLFFKDRVSPTLAGLGLTT